MVPLTPALLIAAASAFIGVGEDGADNHGQMVELFLREAGCQPGDPWCAAFVSHVGYWSHYDHETRRSSWPLPRTASCAAIGDSAKARGALVANPTPGDLFLRYSDARKRFVHTGIVVGPTTPGAGDALGDGEFSCLTIEGNTNDDGSANGRTTLLRTRCLTPATGDRFVRWTALMVTAS